MNQPEPSFILHLCAPEEWQQARAAGEYRAASLESQGFIHCSRPDQIVDVANRYYRGMPRLLLWIDPTRLRAEVRREASEGDIYPHIYGPINLEAVIAAVDYLPDPDGTFRHPPDRI